MKISFLKTRFVAYIFLLAVLSWLMFNFLISTQSSIMHKYFIEKPTSYNLERAERLAGSIYKSFKAEVSDISPRAIREFVERYDSLPFLSVNFVYKEDSGEMRSVLRSIKETDILSAEYIYPVRQDAEDIGTLLVYDINKEYKKGLEEYDHVIAITRFFFGTILFLLTALLVYKEYSSKISEEKTRAEYLAIHDGLTGLYTQKYFKHRLEREVARSKRYKSPLSLIMCDVDHFKKFNDTYGHLEGDRVLKVVSDVIMANVRSSDIVARYGGEEFAILLLESGEKSAVSFAGRIKALTDKSFDVALRIKTGLETMSLSQKLSEAHITVSIGISCYDCQDGYMPERLISTADGALYHSKNSGRNRISLYCPKTKGFEHLA